MPTEARITQVVIETVVLPNPEARVTQVAIETVVARQISLPAISGTTVYAPALSVIQSVTASTIAGSVLHAPAIIPDLAVTGGTIASSSTLFVPSLTGIVSGAHISSTALFTPIVSNIDLGIFVPSINSTVLYPPSRTVDPILIEITNVLKVTLSSSGDIQVITYADPSASSTIASAPYDDGAFHDIDIRGQMSAWFEEGQTFLPNGYYEVLIDDEVVLSKTGILLYSTNHQYSNQGGHPAATFNEVSVNPLGGNIDCLRIGPYTYGEAPVPVCCTNQGPGGSPTTPPPTGPGVDPPPIVLPPIVIPDGGEDPPLTYTPCPGGGVPVMVDDPDDGESLADAVTPVVKIEWTLADGSIRRSAKLPIHKPATIPYQEEIVSYSPISYAMADHQGNIEALSASIGFNDSDKAISSVLTDPTNQYIIGRRIQGWIESDANRRAGLTPFRLFSAVITNYPELSEDLTLTIPIADELGYRYSPFSFDRQMPFRTLRPEMFPNLPLQNQGLSVPIIYGEMSDESRVNDPEPNNIPYGIVPTFFLGTRDLTPIAGGAAETWDAYLVCGHAIKSIAAWFGSNLSVDSSGSVRMAASSADAGGDFLIPGYSNWDLYFTTPYTDLTDTNGVTERYTIIYAKGLVSDAAVGGGTPITLNVCGIETVGDGSGDLITDIAYQVMHFIAYWVLPDISYRTGEWGDIPIYPTMVPKISTTSFQQVKEIHDARLDGGYPGAWELTTQAAVKEILVDLQIGGGLRLWRNNHGQIGAFTLDETQDISDLVVITAEQMQKNSFKYTPRVDEIENVIPYLYGPEPATGRYTGPKQFFVDTNSVTNYLGERRAQDIAINTTRSADVANDVILRRGLWSSNTPGYVQFTTDLGGLDLRLGQLIRVKHYAGLGLTGWTDRILLVTKIQPVPEETEFNVQVFCEDVHRLFV